MSKLNCANSAPLRYLSPSNADRCWRELIKSSQKDHPFKTEACTEVLRSFPTHKDSMYHSTYSFPKKVILERAKFTSNIPPAGIPSFHRNEPKRPELAALSKNAEYQALLAEHLREEISPVRSSNSSVRSS